MRNLYIERDELGKPIFLYTKDIMAYCGISRLTLSRWIKEHAFPACKIPDGRWITTPSLIDAWILARNPYIKAMRQKASNGESTTL